MLLYIPKQARGKWREFGDKEIESQEIMRVQTGVVRMERRDLGKINMGRTSSRDAWGREQEVVLSLRTGDSVLLGRDRFGWVEDLYM